MLSSNSLYQDTIIIGAGCVGQSLAAALLNGNPRNRVFLIPSTRHVSKIQDTGIDLRGAIRQKFAVNERFIVIDHFNYQAIKTFQLHPLPCIFIATKAPDAINSLRTVKDVLFHNSPILICLQNGLGTEQAISTTVSLFDATVLKGHVFAAISQKKSHLYTYTGRIIIEANPTSDEFLNQRFDADLNRLFHLELSDNILAAIYPKLTINCICNPLTVIFNQKLGFLCQHNQALIVSICEELAQLASALNLPFKSATMLASIVFETMKKYTHHYSSMHADIQHAKKTEINTINGAVLRLGQENALAMPLNNLLYTSIRHIENLRNHCGSASAFYKHHAAYLTNVQHQLLHLSKG